MGVALFAGVLVRIVRAPQRQAAAQRFDVDAAAAAGAIIDGQSRVASQQFVPERVEPFDPANLGDALTVRRVSGAPEFEWRDVGVVAVPVDAVLGNTRGDEIGEESARGRIAQIKQTVVFDDLVAIAFVRDPHGVGLRCAPVVNAPSFGYFKQPLRMLTVPGRTFADALRFEPQQELHAGGASGIADGLEALRIDVPLQCPIAGVQVPAPLAEPLGVDPVNVDRQAVLGDLRDAL